MPPYQSMSAVGNILPPPPISPSQKATQPESVSPYFAHVNAMSLMRHPQHLGGGANPDALDILLVDGKDTIRNAPLVKCSPEHITIQKMNAACTSGDLNLLQMLIAEWWTSLDPHPGPPGYEIYALEPVFYHAIRESQGGILEYFFNHGIQLCRLAIQEAIKCGSSSAVFQVFIGRGWDINDNPPGEGTRWFPYSPLRFVPLPGSIVDKLHFNK